MKAAEAILTLLTDWYFYFILFFCGLSGLTGISWMYAFFWKPASIARHLPLRAKELLEIALVHLFFFPSTLLNILHLWQGISREIQSCNFRTTWRLPWRHDTDEKKWRKGTKKKKHARKMPFMLRTCVSWSSLICCYPFSSSDCICASAFFLMRPKHSFTVQPDALNLPSFFYSFIQAAPLATLPFWWARQGRCAETGKRKNPLDWLNLNMGSVAHD